MNKKELQSIKKETLNRKIYKLIDKIEDALILQDKLGWSVYEYKFSWIDSMIINNFERSEIIDILKKIEGINIKECNDEGFYTIVFNWR